MQFVSPSKDYVFATHAKDLPGSLMEIGGWSRGVTGGGVTQGGVVVGQMDPLRLFRLVNRPLYMSIQLLR